MNLLSILRAAINGKKTTTSGLVESHNSNESQPLVDTAMVNALNDGRVPYCADAAALQALDGTECKLAYLEGVGMFAWYTGIPIFSPGYPYYIVGLNNYWAKKQTETMASIGVDETGIANGKFIMWNGTKYVLSVPTVSALDWANVTNKPIITGTTNPAIAGNLAVGGSFAVTGNAGVGGTLAAGNTIITGTLSASGATTTAGISNTGNIATGTLSSTGNGTIGGILNVNAAGTSIIQGNLTVNTALTVGDDFFALGDIFMSAGNIICPGSWTTGARPTPPANTYPMGFNLTIGKHEGWNGSTWNAFY